MAWDSVPWFVAGANHSVEVARLFAYAATSGAEGVILPDDLKVRALSTPGSQVRAAPGGAILLNRYAGGGQQSYVGRNPTQDNVAITATGSAGGRRDLIVARVADPQYPGTSAPTDPNDFQYIYTEVIEDVPAGITRARDLNLNYPAIELALLDIPANTATITNAMITDLRKVALPRKDRTLLVKNFAAGEIHDLGSSNFQQWPNENFDLFIPEWATQMNVIADWVQVRVSAGDRAGEVWVRFHDGESWPSTARNRWDLTGVPNTSRMSIRSAAPMSVPAAFRGQTVRVNLMGRNLTGGSGSLRLDGSSSVTLDVEFLERAV